MTQRFEEWQPVRAYGQGLQPRTGKHWNCVPAWDVAALYREADEELPHPQRDNPDSDNPNKDKKAYVFWNRHIDRRYHIEYPHATRKGPRVQGRTICEPGKEWDVLIEYRDRYLADAGLTLDSPARDIAVCMADTFKYEKYFKDKDICPTFPDPDPPPPEEVKIPFAYERALGNPIEALVYKAFCVGCAHAYAALVDSCGFAVRTIGCGSHRVAEVRVDGRWHMVDNGCRHEANAGLTDAFFESNFMHAITNPTGDHGEKVLESYPDSLWRRINGQYHFPGGVWQSSPTLRFCMGYAYALYPELERWGYKSETGKRVPILLRAGGFYWEGVVHQADGPDCLPVKRAAMPPMPMYSGDDAGRNYYYHPFRPGEKLRQSVWLDAVDDMEGLEIVLSFGPSKATDFSDSTGKQMMLKIGDCEQSLSDMGVWPPKAPENKGEPLTCTVVIPTEMLKPNAVNWIELSQKSATMFHMPYVPALLEPYIAPLWSETEDRVNPPLPCPA